MPSQHLSTVLFYLGHRDCLIHVAPCRFLALSLGLFGIVVCNPRFFPACMCANQPPSVIYWGIVYWTSLTGQGRMSAPLTPLCAYSTGLDETWPSSLTCAGRYCLPAHDGCGNAGAAEPIPATTAWHYISVPTFLSCGISILRVAQLC